MSHQWQPFVIHEEKNEESVSSKQYNSVPQAMPMIISASPRPSMLELQQSLEEAASMFDKD
jgi:hypothetical protein